MLYEDSQKEIHIGGVINKQCVLWRMSRLCLGIINSAPGGDKTLSFFVLFLFYICLFPAHRDSDQSLINEDGLQTWFNDFKQALQLRMNAVRTVWEVYDLCLTNPGLNLPAGVWTLLSFCICTTPQFHDPRDFTFFLQRFKWPTLGQWKPVPTRDSYFSFNWACFNLFSSQTPDVQHSCNCWRRGLWFTVIHVILMWFIWLPEVR